MTKKQYRLADLFPGKKAKWLPLYRRLTARFTKVSGLELIPSSNAVAIEIPGQAVCAIGQIKIRINGLCLGLALPKGALKSPRLKPTGSRSNLLTHQVIISDAEEIDDELLAWVRAANLQARISKRRST